MSIFAFSQGFGQGVDTGVVLGESIMSGRSKAAMTDANEIFAQMEGLIPTALGAQAIPGDDGSMPASTGANAGYDGNEWDSYKQKYLAALKNVTDYDALAAMQGRLAELEKGKVMENGRMALAAIQSGDSAKAQRYIANISYYTDPGITPEVMVDKGGNTFIQTPEGQMALTPGNLEEFLHQMEDFDGWRQLTFDKQRHADNLEHETKVLAANIFSQNRRDDAYIAGIESQIAGRAFDDELTLARTQAVQQEMEQATETHLAGLDADAREKYTSDVAEIHSIFDSFYTDPARLNFNDGGSPTEPALDASGFPIAAEDGGGIPEGSDSQVAVDNLTQSASESQAFLQQQAAAKRLELEANPLMKEFAFAMMDGLRAGDEDGTMSNEMIARLAFMATHDTDGFADYDPESGSLRIGSPGNFTYYEVGLRHRPLLNQLWGASSESEDAQLPPEQGPPMPGAVPEPAGAGG